MPAATTATDAELVTRAAGGDRAAFAVLFERHADAVHDHVARWSRDAELAADATREAFAHLLGELKPLQDQSTAVLPWLLRTARDRAVERLQEAGPDRVDAPIATAVLAASPTDRSAAAEVTATSHDAAARVWEAAEQLDDRTFTALDLHVRRGLRGAETATVMDTTSDEAGALVDAARERMRTQVGADAADPVRTYEALSPVRAPVAVRNAVMTAADEHFGTTSLPSGLRLAVPIALALLLLATVGAIALELRSTDTEAGDGPPTAAGELLSSPSPSPSPEPSPTPTLDTLASPSAAPVPSPEASASPAPSPDSSPEPSPQPLVVQIEQPAAGAVFDATTEDDLGRQAAAVTVAATTAGGSGADPEVTWTSSEAPGEVLLDSASGDLLLWLGEACADTPHTLTATATDEATGESATSSLQVTIMETCVEPLGPVRITSPADQSMITAIPTTDGPHEATLQFSGEAPDGVDWSDVVWRWTTDRPSDGVLLEQEGGEQSGDRTQLTFDDCEGTTQLVLVVDVERASDGSTAQDRVTINVDCVASP